MEVHIIKNKFVNLKDLILNSNGDPKIKCIIFGNGPVGPFICLKNNKPLEVFFKSSVFK